MTDAASAVWTKAILYSWNTDNKSQLWTVSMSHDAQTDRVEIRYNEYGLLDYVDGVLSGDAANADKVSYDYDSDYRLAKLKYYIFNTITSQYEQVDVDYTYDSFGRLESIEDRLGLTSEYAYNTDSTLKSLTLPNGTVTEYTYDDLRRLVSIATTGLTANDIIAKYTYHYNDLGLRDSVTMADGRTTEWSYDDVGRLVQEHFKKPDTTTLLRYLYAYDAAGNRTSKKTDYDADDGSFAATTTYTNNAYNQLTTVSGDPGRGTKVNVTGTIPTGWTLQDTEVAVTPNEGDPVPAEIRGRFFIARNVPLQNGANELVASTSVTTLADHSPSSDTVEDVALDTSVNEAYTYNANGDLTVKSEEGGTILWSYTYSVDGWLTKVEGPDGLVEQYYYDPIGRKYKISTTEGAETTERYFVYDGGIIIIELDDEEELSKEFVRGLSLGGGIGGLLYSRDTDGSVGYFHYDGQGNVVSVTDESCLEVAYYEYDAWGNVLTYCGTLSNEFRFSTKQTSLGTGLVDFRFRWYDSISGRWIRRDPKGIAGGANTYAYLGGDPNNTLDPDGRGPINWALTGNWNASRSELQAFWDGFNSSLNDQQYSMSMALFGDAACWAYGVPSDVETKDLYEMSAWGQSGGTWAEIPTKVSIITATVATAAIIVCEVGPAIVRTLRSLGNRGFLRIAREGHHLLPRQFQAYFARAGLNIAKYVIPLERALHRLRPGGIHCGPDSWNRMWERFITQNPNANAPQILEYLDKLRQVFGI